MKKLILTFIICIANLLSYSQLNNPIKWSYASKRISATQGVIYLKATIDSGWHIYSVNQKAGGPLKTIFSFNSSPSFALNLKVNEPKPIVKYEEVFEMDVMYFEGAVVFSQKINIKSKMPFIIKGKVEYMACTNKECLPPAEVSFSIPVK